ncbi:hypothetical protein ACVIJW_004396 [Bradyrhizobium barranii subsp. barranii]
MDDARTRRLSAQMLLHERSYAQKHVFEIQQSKSVGDLILVMGAPFIRRTGWLNWSVRSRDSRNFGKRKQARK